MTGQPPGWYRFVVASRSTASTIWTTRTVDAYVDIPTVSLEINRSGTGTGSIVGTGLSCPGGSTTQAMPCGASYALGTVAWITAVPDPGSTFAGWGGGCLGPQVTCGVTLNGDRYTFAYFTKTPGTVATTYYHPDAIGSVRALSDQTGATVIRHDYRPFGEDTQPLAGDPMRFAGKELDPESALMNFEARYYRNRYAYAGNNPLRFVDPFGTCQYDPTTDRFTNTDGCVSLTVTAPYVDVVGAPVCIGYNANGEPYQQVSCSDQAIPGGDAYSGGGPQPGRSYPVIYLSAVPVLPNGQPQTPNDVPNLPKPPVGKDGKPNEWVEGRPSGNGDRETKYKPRSPIPGRSQPQVSWDDNNGHWDYDEGVRGGKRRRFLPDGTELDENHNPIQSSPIMRLMRTVTPQAIINAGATATLIYFVVSEGSRVIPLRNLIPVP
jgi:hypothetical protein